eukprot:2356568-Pyramimonas_sp.AAC.1
MDCPSLYQTGGGGNGSMNIGYEEATARPWPRRPSPACRTGRARTSGSWPSPRASRWGPASSQRRTSRASRSWTAGPPSP